MASLKRCGVYINRMEKTLRRTFKLLAAVALAALGGTSAAMAGTTERVSVDSAGAQGDSYSYDPSISADGRYVAFNSSASSLVAGDTNGTFDIFVRDRLTGQTERVSVDSVGAQGYSPSFEPSISADGRYVAFNSLASNLVAGDTNGTFDIFVRDRLTGQTERVSVDSVGAQGDSDSFAPSISADGRYVAFNSSASNLVAGDSNGTHDIFVRDRLTGQTERVSLDSAGAQGDSLSFEPSISADGRYVAFYSSASNLVAGDSNGTYDVFVRDRVTGQTERVSLDSAGAQGNSDSYAPSISADGRHVAFSSLASNLVAGDTNGALDIFVRDRVTGQTERVSMDSAGVQGNSHSAVPSISADGRYVAFRSYASNLVAGDTNGALDIFVRDRVTGQTERVSVDQAGVQGNSQSLDASISADGRYVAFRSLASNLVAGDTNDAWDIFVRDRGFLYTFIGFNSPVDNLPLTNSAKAGATVPVKWQLTDGGGNFISDLGAVKSLQYSPTACDSQDTELADPIETYAPGESGLQYDAATNEFLYPWKTRKTQKGTCAVFALTLADGQQQFARFWLK
jgi:Tol biopolymer transport system component